MVDELMAWQTGRLGLPDYNYCKAGHRSTLHSCVSAFLTATGRRRHTQVNFLWIMRRFEVRTIAVFPINSEPLDAGVFTSMLPATKHRSRTCPTRATDVFFERKHCSRRRRHTQVELLSSRKNADTVPETKNAGTQDRPVAGIRRSEFSIRRCCWGHIVRLPRFTSFLTWNFCDANQPFLAHCANYFEYVLLPTRTIHNRREQLPGIICTVCQHQHGIEVIFGSVMICSQDLQ